MLKENIQEKFELARPELVELANLADCREEIMALIESVKLSVEDIDNGEVWLVYRIEGKIIGCMTLERRGNLVYIQSLSVNADFRRRGIARALVDRAWADFVCEGESLVALTLFWNKKIYEHLGFVQMEAAALKRLDDVAGRKKHKYCGAYLRCKD